MPKKSTSLFDDIFRLQSTAPDEDVDPEDLDIGLKASLVEGADEAEALGVTNLRKKTAIIPDDPKYKGKKASRKDLYSDEEEDHASAESSFGEDIDSEASPDRSDSDEKEDEDEESESGDDEDDSDVDSSRVEESMEQSESDGEEENENDNRMGEGDEEEDAVILPTKKSDDREKGKAVVFQLGIWDDLIKIRIAMQKLVSACNCLPQTEDWADMEENEAFKRESRNVHSSVRKYLSALLELQNHLSSTGQASRQKSGKEGGSDEEITSESENENAEEGKENNDVNGANRAGKGRLTDDNDDEDEEEEESDEMEEEDAAESLTKSNQAGNALKEHHPQHRARHKRKLEVDEVDETLAKRHTEFQSFRNDTLSKWDEKTRLSHGKIKAKNFAAFEIPVLKQIEQVLVNRDRLIKRIHQKRVDYKIVGKREEEDVTESKETVEVDDDDEDVELKLKQRSKNELSVDNEIVDDNDFYHVCLRDLIEMKQNEETDPVTANKQWLEIQRLRNKQKKKVDTKASKGRKIRYNVKEKLKNFMTPYDKSIWSDEQKDDLFKALFGGRGSQQDDSNITEDQGFVLGI